MMAWQDRIKEAAYTSPSGVRLTFDYEDISKSVDKKTASFDFPDAQGTYVQDLGNTGRRYPLRVIFWGDDHDLAANAFEQLLLEIGIGELEHPLYGLVNVVPFGSINFRNDLKTSANQSIIEVTFWATIGLVYPTEQLDPASAVLTAVEKYNAAAAQNLEQSLDIDSEVEKSAFKSGYQSLLNSVTNGLESIASTQENVKKQFDAVNDSINNGIDVLISDPLTLGFQTAILIQAPARAATSVSDRLDAYKNLLTSITTGQDVIEQPSLTSENSNNFHTNELYSMTYITGLIVAVLNNQFETKLDALQSADLISEQADIVTTWRDDNYKSLSEIDTGDAYQKLMDSVALTIGFLVQISFSLKQERRVRLEQPGTMIEIISALYPVGTVIDDELDFFIQSNSLTGSEILEISRGREIVYYV